MSAPVPTGAADDFRAELPGGVAIFVPDSLECLTTFTLRERGDWFEDELRWIRRTFGKGLRAIDVGANFGCYALSLAALGAGSGRIVAYEPNPACAARLKRSAAANNFKQLEIREVAVAEKAGRAVFSSSAQTESGQLGGAAAPDANAWEVPVVSLDDEFAKEERGFDLIKLDAEGAELRVLAGARRFLDRTDPLLLCELRHGATVNEPLLRDLQGRGFHLYRLAPGPAVLVPLRPGDETDRFILNVFACRPSMAAKLAACGRLELDSSAPLQPVARPAGGGWLSRPYAQALGLHDVGAEFSEVWTALHDPLVDRPAERLWQTLVAWTRGAAVEEDPWVLQSAARVAEALGYRERAVVLLRRALKRFSDRGVQRPTRMFLPASARFEEIAPAPLAFDAWALASVADALDRLERHCGWFQPPELNELQRLVMQHGFGDEALMRRVTLVRRRALAREAAAKTAP